MEIIQTYDSNEKTQFFCFIHCSIVYKAYCSKSRTKPGNPSLKLPPLNFKQKEFKTQKTFQFLQSIGNFYRKKP